VAYTRRILVAAGSLALLAPGACADSREAFSDPSMPIEMARGAEFDIALKSNQSTGYRWVLVDSAALGPLRHVGTAYAIPRRYRDNNGAGGTERWTFATPRPGSGVITLVYVRPWEGTAARDTTRFRVRVR
jgi:predicted secreted protein